MELKSKQIERIIKKEEFEKELTNAERERLIFEGDKDDSTRNISN